MAHIVFLDSTSFGLSALTSAKSFGHTVTFVRPRAESFLNISRVSPEALAHAEGICDYYLEVVNLKDPLLLQMLESLNDRVKIDAVVTTSEFGIIPCARIAARFSLNYANEQALCNAIYKDCCRRVLDRANVKSVRYEVRNIAELKSRLPEVGFPCVVKPTRGFGKQLSAICFNEAEFFEFAMSVESLRDSCAESIISGVSEDYIIEEYIYGDLVSAETVVVDGIVNVLAVVERLRATDNALLEIAACTPSDRSDKREVQEYVNDVLIALEISTGLYHIELIRSNDGIRLVEINARMMGSISPIMFKAVYGIDPFMLLLELHLTNKMPFLPEPFGAAITIAIGSKVGGIISAEFTNEALVALLKEHSAIWSTLSFNSGSTISLQTGNLSALGHVVLHGESYTAAVNLGKQFISKLSNLVGLPLNTFS